MQIHGNHPTLGGEINTVGWLGRHRKALYNCQELWGSKILLYLQTDRLACHRLKEADGRGETPESEAKGCIFLIATAGPGESALFAPVPKSQFTQDIMKRAGDTCRCNGGNPWALGTWTVYVCSQCIWPLPQRDILPTLAAESMAALCFTGKQYLSLPML